MPSCWTSFPSSVPVWRAWLPTFSTCSLVSRQHGTTNYWGYYPMGPHPLRTHLSSLLMARPLLASAINCLCFTSSLFLYRRLSVGIGQQGRVPHPLSLHDGNSIFPSLLGIFMNFPHLTVTAGHWTILIRFALSSLPLSALASLSFLLPVAFSLSLSCVRVGLVFLTCSSLAPLSYFL